MLKFLPRLSVLLLVPFLSFSIASAQSTSKSSRASAQSTSKSSRASVSAELNVDALQPGQQAVIAVVLEIGKKFHAQSHTPLDENLIPTVVSMSGGVIDGVTTYEPIYPPASEEEFPALGKISIYSGRAIFYVPIQVDPTATAGEIKLSGSIRFQICNDRSCFPPEMSKFEITTRIVAAGQSTQSIHGDDFAGFDPKVFSRLVRPIATSQPTTQASGDAIRPDEFNVLGLHLDRAPIALAFVAAFFVGVIFNVVPCVLPVLPLKAIGFYEISQHNRAKCIAFGLVFSLGIVACFAFLGFFVVVLRIWNWSAWFANVWVLSALIVILLAMALQLFGAFSVGLPIWVYKIETSHDSYVGNFLFGILTAVLSTPCTIGLFTTLLSLALLQSPAVGLSLVIVVGIGMASPYLLLSAVPELARRFPRTGPWPELVKQMLGFLVLASALFFARRFVRVVVSEDVFWYLFVVLAVAAGLFLVLRATRIRETFKTVAITSTIATVIALLTFAFVWQQTHSPIKWQPYSDKALATARAEGRPVMLEFTAAWCTNCIALEATVFHDKTAVVAIRDENVLTLRADLTDDDAPGWKILRQINPAGSIPLTAIYRPKTETPTQLSGLYSTGDLVTALKS